MNSLNKQNILLLIPNLNPGGAQRVFHDHSLALSEQYTVLECVFNTDDGIAYPTNNTLINLKVPAGKNIILKLYYFFVRCIRLKRVKKNHQITICISHLEGADYVNILSKGTEKVVLCIHGSKIHDLNIAGAIGMVRKKLLMPYLYNRADKIVTVSKDISTELIKNFGVLPGKIQTINNFFNIESIQQKACYPLPSIYQKLFADNLVIITSGRLSAQKNQAPLLSVFSKLLPQQASKLVILGDGELRHNLVLYSKQLGLKTYTIWDNVSDFDSFAFDVYFLGYQENPFKYLKQATLFAFPSAWEGFPMALCEAMICGVPVITTDCPTGPREILAPDSSSERELTKEEFTEYGVLMPLLNQQRNAKPTDLWSKTIQVLLSDTKLLSFYKARGLQRMLDFTPEKIMKQWINIIDQPR